MSHFVSPPAPTHSSASRQALSRISPKASSKALFRTHHGFPAGTSGWFRPRWLGRLRLAIRRMIAESRARRERRQAMATLLRCDDHTLRDIGVHRCDLEAALRTGNRY